MKKEENKKVFEVDGNKLIADFENNQYFIIFKNYENKEVTSEIPKAVFDVYVDSKKIYKRNQNEQERHWEFSELTEITLYRRASKYQESIEATIINKETKENLHIAISQLPSVQNKRVKMKYFEKKKERELAEKEQTSIRAIQYSLHCGIENLKKLKKFFE